MCGRRGGGLASSLPTWTKKYIYICVGKASLLAGDFLRKEEGNFYLAPLLLPFYYGRTRSSFLLELQCNNFISLLAFAALLWKVISNLLLYTRSSCYGVFSQSCLTYTLEQSLKFPSARCQMNASDSNVCWINWEGSICWLRTNSKTHPHLH